MKPPLQISKSEYMMFLKHPAWLWLKKHDKSKLPPPDDNLQAMFDAGNTFEAYAEQLFPDGTHLGFSNYDEYRSLPARTTKALESGASTIFQGRFEYEQLTFICDVIRIVSDREVDLCEIKASTRAKPEHELDLAFQLVVLEGCGYSVRNISVVHVNNDYVRQGDIDAVLLTKTTDVTAAVKARREQTKRDINSALQVVAEPTMPNPSPSRCRLGSLGEWMEVCRGLGGVEVGEGSIYDLARIDPSLVGELEDQGITRLKDIPEQLVTKPQQKLQLKALGAGRAIVDEGKISRFLGKLEYPLYFLDYETMSSVVPYFDGMRPYGQYPFQYSLHVIDHPGSAPRHTGYLHKDSSNPVKALSQALASQIGNKGSVLAWYMAFEKSCNTTMSDMIPEYKEFYESINTRMVDLMVPFSKGWYADAGFMGSASIKKVMPVLAPDLSYKVLGIQEGGAAQRLWTESVLDGKREGEKAKILEDLDRYCELDTLAMVEILGFLAKLSGQSYEPKPVQLSIDF